MTAEHRFVNTAEIIVTLIGFGVGLFVFSTTEISDIIIMGINHALAFSEYSGITVLAGIFGTVFLITLILGRGPAFAKVTYFLAWMLVMPAMLSFSTVDWLNIIQIAEIGTLFATTLPFEAVFAAGAFLICVDLFYYFADYTRLTQKNLIRRGAPERDVAVVARKAFTFLSGVVIVSAIPPILLVLALPRIEPALVSLFAGMPNAAAALTIAAFIALSIGTAIYLTGEAQIKKEKEKN